jgi:hypothetical protein
MTGFSGWGRDGTMRYARNGLGGVEDRVEDVRHIAKERVRKDSIRMERSMAVAFYCLGVYTHDKSSGKMILMRAKWSFRLEGRDEDGRAFVD